MMTTEKKITKRDRFVEIIEILEDAERTDLIDVMKHEIELLDKKAESAKASAAKRKASHDALADAVLAALTDEPTLIADVAAKVEGEDVTIAKVTYRLGKLVESGAAVKTTISVGGGEGSKARKLAAYSLAPADAD